MVSWKPPKDNPGAVTGYKVSYKKFRDAKFRTVSVVKEVCVVCSFHVVFCVFCSKKKKNEIREILKCFCCWCLYSF